MKSLRPPLHILETARTLGMRSPCSKSKRGVVIFDRENPRKLIGVGFNAPPAPFVCDATDACRASCSKICIHAEDAAIDDAHDHHVDGIALRGLDLVHVKVDGVHVVPGGPPSCWQCSRRILAQQIDGVWLFEGTACPSHHCPMCTGEICNQCSPVPAGKRCEHAADERHKDAQPPQGEWRYYTALEFHIATGKNCGLHLGELAPALHVLWNGKAICNGPYVQGTPSQWQRNQQWISLRDVADESLPHAIDMVTCVDCKLAAPGMISGLRLIGAPIPASSEQPNGLAGEREQRHQDAAPEQTAADLDQLAVGAEHVHQEAHDRGEEGQVSDHHATTVPRNSRVPVDNPVIACECGCGARFRKYDAAGRVRRFSLGHNAGQR